MRKHRWTDDEIIGAQRLRDAGHGSTQIAAILTLAYGRKRTRNSVIGMLWRIEQEAGA